MATLAAYAFDEGSGTTAADSSGNGNDIDLAGSTASFATGHTNTGLTSATANSGTLVANPPFGQTPERTVMFWGLGSAADGAWWIRWQVTSIDSGAWGILSLGGEVGVQARNSGGFVRPSVAIPADAATAWHHYAGTYDGVTVRFFLDGVEVASDTLTPPLRTDADFLDVCVFGDGSVMDDLRIMDTALDAATITSLMNTAVGETATVEGSGSVTAAAAVVDGSGSVAVTGSGALTAPAAVLSGAGATPIDGAGSIVAPGAVIDGSGAVVIAGSGSVIAPAAVVEGSELPPADVPGVLTLTAVSDVHELTAVSETLTIEGE